MTCYWKPLDRLTGRPAEEVIEIPEHLIKRDSEGYYCSRCGVRLTDL